MEQKTDKKLQRYPYYFGLLAMAGLGILAQILVILDCFFPLITYEVDAVSSVMSTCSEVVAGMYGITLTGYIFFADRFRDTSSADESLYDAVQSLLLRYNHMAGFISVMSLICIMGCEGIVLYGSNTLLPQSAYRFLVNEILLLFLVTFNFILYFVISVLDPHKVSRISSQKKAKLSKDQSAGDSDQFLADWAAITDCLYGLRDKLFSTVHFIPGGKGKPEIVRTLETLRNYGRIGYSLWRDLEKLRQYYNLTLHDPTMSVSQEMCDLAAKVLKELKEYASK